MKNPRHCLPFAVITFMRDESIPSRGTAPERWLKSVPMIESGTVRTSTKRKSDSASAHVPSKRCKSGQSVSSPQRDTTNSPRRQRTLLRTADQKATCVKDHKTNDYLNNSAPRTAANKNTRTSAEEETTLPDLNIDQQSDTDAENGPSDFIDVDQLSTIDGTDDGSDARFSSDGDEATTSPFSNGYHSSDGVDVNDQSNVDAERVVIGDNVTVDSNHVGDNSHDIESDCDNYNSDTSTTSELTPSEDESDSPDVTPAADKVETNINTLNEPKTSNAIPPNNQSVPREIHPQPKKLSPPVIHQVANAPKKLNPPAFQAAKKKKTSSSPAPASIKMRRMAAEAKRNQQIGLDSDEEENGERKIQVVKMMTEEQQKKLAMLKMNNSHVIQSCNSQENSGSSSKSQTVSNQKQAASQKHEKTTISGQAGVGKSSLKLSESAKQLLKHRLQIRVLVA